MDGSSGGSSTSNNSNNIITRWNPTKDQITILEGLYGQGMRTPTADQIQRITSRLRAYGHIEGKNVFYWFQNHKARQRQKEKELQQQQQQNSCMSFSYMNRRCFYFHDCSTVAPAPGLYRAAPPPSSNNVMLRQFYVANNGTAGAGDVPSPYPELLLPSGTSRRRRVASAADDGTDKLTLSLSATTPFSTEVLENTPKSTLDLFPVHPSSLVPGPRVISLVDEGFSGYVEKCGGGELPDRPFFDFLSVNGCCGQD